LEDPAVRKAYCGAKWNGPTPGQLDPVKETTAAEMRVKAGFSTRTRESAEMNGSDFGQNVKKAKNENEAMREAGYFDEDTTTEETK
jgi:capsid protein